MTNKLQSAKFEEKNCQKIKSLSHSFHFLKIKCIKINPSISIFMLFFFVETIFKMKLNALITEFTDILTVNFAVLI